ncbi:MAG: metal ABC transporter permease [Muribaculaceae bacterium]|nr:metal ABC transporter permease [Muribaculaceae bacterium]
MSLLEYGFFRNALIGILFISVAAAIIGTYVIIRRLVAITGGVTHACFGGLGLGYFLGWNPLIMAAFFAIASALGVEWMSSNHKVRSDSAVAVIWALGMAIGILFVFLTPGYVPELNSFLFGNILTITLTDIIIFGAFTLILLVFYFLCFNSIVVVAFDRDYSAVSGQPVKFINMCMAILVAICVVLTIKMVGIMLLMSMFSLPALIAETRCNSFRSITLWAVIISVVTCVSGLVISAYIDVPCSAIIVIIQVVLFAIGRLFTKR